MAEERDSIKSELGLEQRHIDSVARLSGGVTKIHKANRKQLLAELERRAMRPGEGTDDYLDRIGAGDGITQGPGGIELRAADYIGAMVAGGWENFSLTKGMDQLELRQMSTAPGSAGASVPLFKDREFVRTWYAANRFLQAGARLVTVDGATDWARVTTGPTVEWKAENAAFTPTDIILDAVEARPELVGAIIYGSRELFADSVNIPQIVNSELSGSLAAEIDPVLPLWIWYRE